MTPKWRHTVMEKDDLVWEQLEDDLETCALILKYRPGEAVELHMPIKEGYNAFYRLEYKDGSSTGMRIPCNGIVKFPKEKTRYEVAMMKFTAGAPLRRTPLVSAHSFLYGQMANIILQLSILTFPRTDSLDQDSNGTISVSDHPITMNMNNLIEHTNIPPSILPTHPYSALADMHLTQLTFQHSDAKMRMMKSLRTG
ncbi:hypothetical protein VC83_08958 [Pseudogymnoascus destructans]|uniref:Uncharacterized protein n=1 Tax=Pseudogymnoascus destructans TaxID=655981 RepID=A0A176ZZI6_9PEZI|nr:uncharacterized protein VC83_08958 [Pseudogymnoascus destructans]OAF54740.1 hypothetical protein VC83_08958 [Pseudogymnoascus destructans]